MKEENRNKIKVYRSLRGLHVSLQGDEGEMVLGILYIFKKTPKPVVQAREFGRDFAKKVEAKQIKKISFLRGKSLYHGRVKSFAEGLREGGLEF